jgi:hypothetical protein
MIKVSKRMRALAVFGGSVVHVIADSTTHSPAAPHGWRSTFFAAQAAIFQLRFGKQSVAGLPQKMQRWLF